MTVVFGAFVSADLPALKMIGVGLCVAVLVDASVIRAFVVPAFVSIAGRWNWYPGNRRPDAAVVVVSAWGVRGGPMGRLRQSPQGGST